MSANPPRVLQVYLITPDEYELLLYCKLAMRKSARRVELLRQANPKKHDKVRALMMIAPQATMSTETVSVQPRAVQEFASRAIAEKK